MAALLLAAAALAPLPTTGFVNPEPTVPPQCYTRTGGQANPCWACHTSANGENFKADWTLQQAYAFSPVAARNHWDNLFADRRAEAAKTSDAEILRYVREDNLAALLKTRPGEGYAPDLDYAQGFDADGFARDGSGWRSLRYKPFPGVFWPSNGSTDDVLIRLPPRFRQDAQGRDSRALARLNLALLEAAMTVADTVSDARLQREVEPVSEVLAGADLDGDGRLGDATRIRGLPRHYAGAAADEPLRRWRYPLGTEFLHGVRYLDPEAPDLQSRRLKELRYSRKHSLPNRDALIGAYRHEAEEKLSGRPPQFAGDARSGLRNAYGWTYQGWIEDARGNLRPQTLEETYFCMGCHGGLGITVDSSFAFPRKVPGAAGYGVQTLRGMADAPQAGHREGEVRTWMRRALGGDEFRANDELLDRFFAQGRLVESRFAGRDLHELLAPSRERALALDKSYRVRVREQGFDRGRDAVPAPPRNVHRRIRNGDTGLGVAGRVRSDGRLWIDWSAVSGL